AAAEHGDPQRRAHGHFAPGPGGVVVVVGVVVVPVEVVGASTPTPSVTVEPLGACPPPAGCWLSTLPTWLASLVETGVVLTLKPAAPSIAAAPASFWPTTFGTAASLGACATT